MHLFKLLFSFFGLKTRHAVHALHALRIRPCVKLISRAQCRDHVTPSYLKLQILKLNHLYFYEVAELMH